MSRHRHGERFRFKAAAMRSPAVPSLDDVHRSPPSVRFYGPGALGRFPRSPMPPPSTPELSEPVEVRLRDLRVSDTPVAIVARVVTAERREITRRSDGGRRPVLSGLLSDGTASVRFTWWDPPAEVIERGEILRAVNVQTREFRGRVELTFNWKTRVAPAGEADLPVVRPDDVPLTLLGGLREGDEGVRVQGRVVRVAPKTVSVGSERRLLHEGVLADASGTVAFTAWSDFGLKPGEAIDLTEAYVRTFRGRLQLVLDERSTVRRIPGDGLPSTESARSPVRQRISEVEASRGGELLELSGVVVGLSPPSGLVYRCPDCGRPVRQGICRIHGAVRAEPDLRARLVLDDGTGVLTVELEREATERLWGRTLADCLREVQANPEPGLLEEDLLETVFGRRLLVRGRGTADDFGVTIYPESVDPLAADPRARVARSSGGARP
jgi:replication factor A1